jgi:hypothetical protein
MQPSAKVRRYRFRGLAGAQAMRTPVHDRLLGDPGAFVVDGDLAMSELVARGFHPAARQLGLGEQLPGFANPDLATTQLLTLARSLLRALPLGVHLLVTHDLILSTMVARIRGALWRSTSGQDTCMALRFGSKISNSSVDTAATREPYPIG